jgi:hypothetical protein
MAQVPDKNTEHLLQTLISGDRFSRIEAAHELGRAEASCEAVVRVLERVVASDADEDVREAALEALAAPIHQAVQREFTTCQNHIRHFMVAEIGLWQADGLIAPHVADLLRGRYTIAPSRPPRVRKTTEPGTSLSLSQVLLSQTSVNIALYLGAFFVVAAAFILAALVEVARLPILGITTIAFFVTAGSLSRRLPLASFVLSIVGTLMIPIDAGVLFDLLEVPVAMRELSWAAVAGLVGTVLMAENILYRSRLFSGLSFVAYSAAIVLLDLWLDADLHVSLLLLGIPALAGLGSVQIQRRWRGESFAWPLLGLSQALQIGLLAVSAAALLIQNAFEELPDGGLWLVVGGTWIGGTIFYIVSDCLYGERVASRLKRAFPIFAVMTTVCLMPVPLFLLGVFSPAYHLVMAVTWAWGAILALTSEGLIFLKWERVRAYAPFLLSASFLLFAIAAIGELSNTIEIAIGYLVGTCVVYLALTIRKMRWPIWLGALTAAYAAYLSADSLPAISQLDIFPGYGQLLPALAFLAGNLVARQRFQASQSWSLPPLVLGLLVCTQDVTVTLGEGLLGAPGKAIVVFLIYSAFFALYAALDARPWIGYAVTVSLTLALGFALILYEQEKWVLPFVGLAALYYVVGLLLSRPSGSKDWSAVLCWSGLGLGALTSLSAPLQAGPESVIGVAVAASFFAVEAFRQRNIWFGFPTNILYFIAYVIALVELEVTEPQFFSIGAALLGIVMHYLLVRRGHQAAALVTGLLSQLILLSTTFVQMVASEELRFFFILFFQSLVLLAYGLVVRSRSFVFVPILFTVLGVFGVVFTVLSGLPTAITIGCAGIVLLLFGIVALLLREHLIRAADSLGERLGGWQA